MHCVGNCVVIRYCYKAICNGEMELFREKCLLSKSILLLLFNIWTILLLFRVCHAILLLSLEVVHQKAIHFGPQMLFHAIFGKHKTLFFNPFQTVSIYTFLRPRYISEFLDKIQYMLLLLHTCQFNICKATFSPVIDICVICALCM